MIGFTLLSKREQEGARLDFDTADAKVVWAKSWERKTYKRLPTAPGFHAPTKVIRETHQRFRVRFEDGQFETFVLVGEQVDLQRGDRVTLLWATPTTRKGRWELAGLLNQSTGDQQVLSDSHHVRSTPAYGSVVLNAIGAGCFAALIALGFGEMPSEAPFWYLSLGTAFCVGALRMGALSTRVTQQLQTRLSHIAGGVA